MWGARLFAEVEIPASDLVFHFPDGPRSFTSVWSGKLTLCFVLYVSSDLHHTGMGGLFREKAVYEGV
jgi:hypothetical protein